MPSAASPSLVRNLKAALLRVINEDALVSLLLEGEIEKIPAGTEFVKQNRTQVTGLSLILSGLVSQDETARSGERVLTGVLAAGEFIGEVTDEGQVARGMSPLTYRAQEDTVLVRLPSEVVESWFARHPNERQHFTRYLRCENEDRRLFAAGIVGNS